MSQTSILNYIQSQQWFFGIRAEAFLFAYSAKNSESNYVKNEYGVWSGDSILFPLKKGYPIRVFNLEQKKRFHAVSLEKVMKNPQVILKYIKQDVSLFSEIEKLNKKFSQTIENDDVLSAKKQFLKIVSLYSKTGALFNIIFSLGLKLTENKDKLKNIKQILHKHDVWRNGVALPEEKMFIEIFYFLDFWKNKKKLSFKTKDLMVNLTIDEIILWLDNKLSGKKVEKIIEKRKKQGYVFYKFENKNGVIDDLKEITKIKKHFLKLKKESENKQSSQEIKGTPAYSSNKKIKGQVIVIKDKSALAKKSGLIDGKILVAVQTTPHFIPYMQKAVAFVTDEGGLTCHAAIVAREMKKDCIVGTKNATLTLKDGDWVEVDAKEGIVKIVG